MLMLCGVNLRDLSIAIKNRVKWEFIVQFKSQRIWKIDGCKFLCNKFFSFFFLKPRPREIDWFFPFLYFHARFFWIDKFFFKGLLILSAMKGLKVNVSTWMCLDVLQLGRSVESTLKVELINEQVSTYTQQFPHN